MHFCPDCGEECNCSGDIDDIQANTEAWVARNCKHVCEPDISYDDCACDDYYDPAEEDRFFDEEDYGE